MPKSTAKRPGDKPAKPHPDFPLTARPDGQWSKKIHGKVHYFGVWDAPQAALNLWVAQKDDLLGGRTSRVRGGTVFACHKLPHLSSAENHVRLSEE